MDGGCILHRGVRVCVCMLHRGVRACVHAHVACHQQQSTFGTYLEGGIFLFYVHFLRFAIPSRIYLCACVGAVVKTFRSSNDGQVDVMLCVCMCVYVSRLLSSICTRVKQHKRDSRIGGHYAVKMMTFDERMVNINRRFSLFLHPITVTHTLARELFVEHAIKGRVVFLLGHPNGYRATTPSPSIMFHSSSRLRSGLALRFESVKSRSESAFLQGSVVALHIVVEFEEVSFRFVQPSSIISS